MTSRASFTLRVLACLLIVGEVALFLTLHRRYEDEPDPAQAKAEPVASAVRDLWRQRHLMRIAEQAIRDGDGARALEALETASFAPRPVEVYRRYYLANAKELLGMRTEARATLAMLWSGAPAFSRRVDVGFHLTDLYQEAGDWTAAERVLATLALDGEPAVSEVAYQRARSSLIAAGDPTHLAGLAHRLAVGRAETSSGLAAAADLEAIGVRLPRPEQIARVARLAEKGDAAGALDLILVLRKSGTTLRLEQARAEVLARQGKRDEADRIVLTFVGRSATLDRELLGRSWRWWSDAATTIENRAWHTIRVRRRIGTRRVKVRGRWVDRPVYTWVSRRVKRSLTRADTRRLEAVHKTLIARGERLLELGIDPDLEATIRRRLASAEESPRRQAKLERHVERLVELNP